MMWKRICLLTVIACSAALPAVSAEVEKKSPTVMQSLSVYAAKIAAERTPPAAEDQAPSEPRRAELRQSLAKILGLPLREPMKAAVLYQKQDDGLVVEEVAYLWAERAYVFAHVIRGKDAAGRRPAIVVVPDRLGHYTRSAYKDFVYQMANQGCLVLFVVDPHVGKRNAPEAGLYAVAAAAGTPVMGVRVFDAMRGLDYLLTRPDVDPERIGLTGLGIGAEAAWLAGALESRFQFVVPVCGTTTFESSTWKQLYAKSGAEDRLRDVRKPGTHDMCSLAPEIVPWIAGRFKSLPVSSAAPLPCAKPEDPDFSMLRYMQRRIARQLASQPATFATSAEWKSRREAILRWLGEACCLSKKPPAPGKVTAQSKQGGLIVETLELPVNEVMTCPAKLVRPAESGGQKRPAVIFSHDSRQCAATFEIAEAAQRLAERGYWVIVPEHASPNPKSLRQVEGPDLAGFYAVADMIGLPPLAMRVADNLAACRYLAGRTEIASDQIVAAGQGVGGVDACLAALAEPRIAGVVSLDATTFRDWAQNVAPEQQSYDDIMPYLPSMPAQADLDVFYAALAPTPLVLAKLKDGWPKSGFQQVVATATSVYRLQACEKALVVVSPREVLEEREKRTPEGVGRQLIAVARSILPPPPTPGSIGSRELVKPRAVVDSASGLVWIIHVQGAVEQEFVDGGYRLTTWDFFNDNGPGQRGWSVTPLIFKKEGDAYKLTGVGKTRANSGEGLQSFPFELTQGSDEVGASFFFGFYTGDPAGKENAGVVEYDDTPQDRMTILTLDGQLDGQKVALGKLYREQSSYPRTYSIQATSTKK